MVTCCFMCSVCFNTDLLVEELHNANTYCQINTQPPWYGEHIRNVESIRHKHLQEVDWVRRRWVIALYVYKIRSLMYVKRKSKKEVSKCIYLYYIYIYAALQSESQLFAYCIHKYKPHIIIQKRNNRECCIKSTHISECRSTNTSPDSYLFDRPQCERN